MAYSIRPTGSVKISPIDSDVKIAPEGYPCTVTRKFVDYYKIDKKLVISPRLRTLEQWAGADISGLRWVDELEGCTFQPKYVHYGVHLPLSPVSYISQMGKSFNQSVVPCLKDFSTPASTWETNVFKYNATTDEITRRPVIMGVWHDAGQNANCNFVTADYIYQGTGGKWNTAIMAPAKNEDATDEMKYSGLWILIGIVDKTDDEGNSLGAIPQYGIYIPTTRDLVNYPKSAYMQFVKFNSNRDLSKDYPEERWNCTIIDQMESPYQFTSSTENEVKFITVQYESINGKIMITLSNRTTEDRVWVVESQDDLFINQGRSGCKIFGVNGNVSFAEVRYSSSASINIIKTIYRPEITLDADIKTIADTLNAPFNETSIITPDTDDHSLEIGIIYDNESYQSRRTPVFYELQEYHRTTFDVPDETAEIDISKYIESIDISYGEFYRGTQVTLKCRNWDPQIDAIPGDEPSPAVAADNDALRKLLSGETMCEIKMTQDRGDSPTPITIFKGYVIEKPFNIAGIWAKMDIKLQDATCLLGKLLGKSPARCGGWDFAEYTTLILNNEFIPSEMIYYPTNYPTGNWIIPFKYGDWSMDFSPETSIIDVLDKVCEVSQMVWYVSQYGNITFDWKYPKKSVPDFVIDETSEEASYFEVLDSNINLNNIASIYQIKGSDARGYPIDFTFKWTPAYDTAKPYYIGRDKYKVLTENNIPNVFTWAQDKIIEEYQNSFIVGWTCEGGKDLWPYDVVQVDLPYVGIGTGGVELFEIVSKTSTLEWSKTREVWTDSFTARIVIQTPLPS